MERVRASLVVVVLCTGLITSAMWCRRHKQLSEDQKFQELFDGYELVLIDDLPKDTAIEHLDVSALRNRYPSERTLVPGRVYVFRKGNQIANETLAIKIFPERLSAIGAHVTKAPKSARELIDLIIGGPLFAIEFTLNGHQGKLANRVHTSERAAENWEELILIYA